MSEPTRKDVQHMRWCVEGARIFSTCAKAKYFATVLDSSGSVIGTGYNGGPKGVIHCEDGGCPRFLKETPARSNYDDCIAIHAEANALLHSNYAQVQGGTLVVNGPPCFTCAKLIVNSGLRRVVYLCDDSIPQWPRVENFLRDAGIELVPVD